MGEARRRKQKDPNSFGQGNYRLINLPFPKLETDIYENPEVLVGDNGDSCLSQNLSSQKLASELSSATRRQLTDAEIGWYIWHQSNKDITRDRSLLIVNPPNKIPPVLLYHFSNRKYFWQLKDNSQQWRFEPTIPVHLIKTSLPEKWKTSEILADMRHWPVTSFYSKHTRKRDYQELYSYLSGHYGGLSLWWEWGNGRNDLEELVLRSPLRHLRPYYDLSVALKEFCFQLWSKDVPMALRAASKEHLWYCAEYSLMLAKLKDHNLTGNKYLGAGKDTISKFNGKVIARRKKNLRQIKAHDQNPFLITDIESLNLLSIEKLDSEGFDWREWIVWLLIDDGVRHAFDTGDETLAHYCTQFLSDYNHFDRLLSGQDVDEDIDPAIHVCMYLNEHGEYVISQQHRQPARPLMPS